MLTIATGRADEPRHPQPRGVNPFPMDIPHPMAVPVTDLDQAQTLVAAAQGGDAAAFGALYDQFAPRVYRYILLRVREPADAEDLLQSVFLKVVRALPRYRDRGLPFAAWLFEVARNAVIDFQRTRRPTGGIEAAAERLSGRDDPADVVADRAERERIRASLDRLTAEQRDVVVYRFFAGLSPREIAALMGKREGSIRALQFRALEALRRGLKPSA